MALNWMKNKGQLKQNKINHLVYKIALSLKNSCKLLVIVSVAF